MSLFSRNPVPPSPACRCCDGHGEVEALDYSMRPCSRCRRFDFELWINARRPIRPPAPGPSRFMIIDEVSTYPPWGIR